MNEPAELDDELIGRVLSGDDEAFQSLMERYRTRVHRLAMRFTRDKEDAEEVLQEVFLTVYQKLGQFQGKSSFSTWLYRVAVNSALMRLRKNDNAEIVSIEDLHEELPLDETETGPGPFDRLTTEESMVVIEKAMDGMPADFKTVLILRDVENFSTDETAEIMNLSPPAVKSRLHRARLFLREKLQDLYKETVQS